ncbi:hypothetical protein TNCV_3977061 [Trichonephila clavipes]|nr:hypothetical protein TNCV_3977061 [Trichonephila clavipes]
MRCKESERERLTADRWRLPQPGRKIKNRLRHEEASRSECEKGKALGLSESKLCYNYYLAFDRRYCRLARALE